MLPFFVYGTLRPGEPNHDLFLRGRTVAEEPARMRGMALYDGPGYPYAVEGRGGAGEVSGEIVTAAPEEYAELLRALVAVAEAGGFTRAAERLHLTQSAVSHQIRRLEDQVGTPLFLRTTRKLALTADGEEFLRHARQILQAHAALSRRFQASSLAGSIRFGVPENFLGDELPQLLSRFARAYPAVRLEASVSVCQDFSARIESAVHNRAGSPP